MSRGDSDRLLLLTWHPLDVVKSVQLEALDLLFDGKDSGGALVKLEHSPQMGWQDHWLPAIKA